MCLIIACPPGKTPDLDVIIDATIENPDGSGWCMRVNGGMESVRSAHSVDHVIGSFWQARERWPNTWAVWHSRLATQGHLVDENTHPFQVTGKPWMLVHNGIMPLSDGPRTGGMYGRSDSRIFAEDHISEYEWTELHKDKAELEGWLGSNKVVILSERREKYGPCLILNADLGVWDQVDGCWYSHSVDKTYCNACGNRSVRCECDSAYSKYRRYTSVSGSFEDGEDDGGIFPPARRVTITANSISTGTSDEDLDEYVGWWEKNDPHDPTDQDCECLDCEEMRYWEAKEAEGHDDIEDLMLRSFALSEAEVDV